MFSNFLRNLRWITFFSLFVTLEGLDFKYYSNEELETKIKELSRSESPSLRKTLYNIGYSSGKPKSGVKPSPLWVLELTAAPPGKLGVPNVKFVGNIHGTEPVGRVILLHFIQILIDEYGKDEEITWLLNNTRIHVLPCLNPDGFAVANQFYCHGCSACLGLGVTDEDVVITSNFPDYFHPNEVLQHTTETMALMKWMEDVKFILSGTFFGTFMVAIYPYCNKNETFSENPTPDDDVFRHLALTYSANHPTMHKGMACPDSKLSFADGVVNGAFWHNHDADMTDYNYIFRGCMEVRFEISCCKYPGIDELENLWMDNKNALLQYSKQANRGITGRILDATTKGPIMATLKIVGRDMEFSNFKNTGEFWRILLPGSYVLQIKAEGYYSQMQNFTVEDYGTNYPRLTNLTVFLLNASIPTTTTTEKTSTTISTTHKKRKTPTKRSTKTTNSTWITNGIQTSQQTRTVRANGPSLSCCHKLNLFFITVIGVLICIR